MSENLLKVRAVSKTYTPKNKPAVHALKSVNLDIKKGEILSLLGVNGAGKTTLSSIIVTLHPPTSGQILYNGESIYADVLVYRRIIGFCPQRPNLDTYLNVEENLRFAGRYFLMDPQKIEERIEFLLNRFHLQKYRKFDVHALSGGYKQRVLIARALMHDPQIVILDEPTVGLDPDIRHQLWDVIRDLKKQGVTVILTTHYLEEAEVLSDRVCILSKGEIILTESIADLKKQHGKNTLEEVFLDLTREDNHVVG